MFSCYDYDGSAPCSAHVLAGCWSPFLFVVLLLVCCIVFKYSLHILTLLCSGMCGYFTFVKVSVVLVLVCRPRLLDVQTDREVGSQCAACRVLHMLEAGLSSSLD